MLVQQRLQLDSESARPVDHFSEAFPLSFAYLHPNMVTQLDSVFKSRVTFPVRPERARGGASIVDFRR